MDRRFTELNDEGLDFHCHPGQSDVTGTEEVYVRRFAADEGTLGEPLRISIGSGTRPRWRGDGTELFYIAAPQGGTRVQMMAVSIKTGGAALPDRNSDRALHDADAAEHRLSRLRRDRTNSSTWLPHGFGPQSVTGPRRPRGTNDCLYKGQR